MTKEINADNQPKYLDSLKTKRGERVKEDKRINLYNDGAIMEQRHSCKH